ncbi:MAG: hypothetical protein IJJ23_03145 [Clostridia bacterium]|nr:hypothetical protein [Clostridia bacterium]
MIAVATCEDLCNEWNNLGDVEGDIYLYLHGEEGAIVIDYNSLYSYKSNKGISITELNQKI